MSLRIRNPTNRRENGILSIVLRSVPRQLSGSELHLGPINFPFPTFLPRDMANRGAHLARGGRGAFYANKYGSKARRENFVERQPSTPFTGHSSNHSDSGLGRIAGDRERLTNELQRVDGQTYGAYRFLEGTTSVKERLI
jgi:hypothetical protein